MDDSDQGFGSEDDETSERKIVFQKQARFKADRKDPESSGENLPWVEKYRPTDLGQLVAHQDIINTISKLIDSGRMPHLLLYGPPGTGKTSTILACARKLYGPAYKSMILELNASDDRGIDVVREQIKDFAGSRTLFSKGFKLIILDEADAMTRTAQFALRRVIEAYTSNARFCIICNYINKIIPALQSRCTRFRFGPLKPDQIRPRLEHVVEKEGMLVEEGALDAVMELAQGDMRKCLNVMQACHLAYPQVTVDSVYACTGNPTPSDIRAMTHALLNSSLSDAFQAVAKLQVEKGLSLVDIVALLARHIVLLSLPPPALAFLLDKLSDIEARLAVGTNERIELGALVGAFTLIRDSVTKAAAAALT